MDTVLLNTEVAFPNTNGSAIASAAAASLKSLLASNPRQVYTASGAALLASAVVAISNVTQSSRLPTAAVSAQIPPGPAPVQYLLKENLVRLLLNPVAVATTPSSSCPPLRGERSPVAHRSEAVQHLLGKIVVRLPVTVLSEQEAFWPLVIMMGAFVLRSSPGSGCVYSCYIAASLPPLEVKQYLLVATPN